MEKIELSELGDFARKVLTFCVQRPVEEGKATLIALSGELGAGKTTFTQVLGVELGIEEAIQSPTYVLMRSYSIPLNPNEAQKDAAGGVLVTHRFDRLVHIDAYRLQEPEEWLTLKPEEFLYNPRNLVVLEWPEQVGELLPKPDLVINFSSEDANEEERFVEVVA